jgi:hypothetical protein
MLLGGIPATLIVPRIRLGMEKNIMVEASLAIVLRFYQWSFSENCLFLELPAG